MTSILKVDTIQDTAGNNIINESGDTITIGASGDTVTIPSGATISNLGTASGFGGFTKLVTSSPSSVSSLDFTSTYINSTYDNYCIIGDLKPATDSVQLYIRFSASGSFLTGASDYGWEAGDMGANQFTENDNDSFIKITRAPVGNASGESISFKIFLQFPSSSGTKTGLVGQTNYSVDNNTHKAMSFGGFRNSAETNDGIRFLFSSGNIASGNVTLYGLEK